MSEQESLNTLLDTEVNKPGSIIAFDPPHNGNGLSVRYSKELGKLAGALAEAQLEFKPIKKQTENTFYSTEKRKAMYADLAAIIEATQKPLAAKGLVVIQVPITDLPTKRAGVVSRLIHSSGEWYECELLLPATSKAKRYDKNGAVEWYEKFDAQTIGAAMTYARRYTYAPTIGVSAEEDDDANSIGEAGHGSTEAQQAVANKKIAEHEAKSKAIPSLFYTTKREDDKEIAYVTGDKQLLSDNKELLMLKGKWSTKAFHFAMDANDLDDLKYELEQRKVPFVKLP